MEENLNNINNELNITNKKNDERKDNKIILCILIILLVGTFAFIGYDKIFNKETPPEPTPTLVPTIVPTTTPTNNTSEEVIEASAGLVKSIRLTKNNQMVKIGNKTIKLRVGNVEDENIDFSGQTLYIDDKLIEKRIGDEFDVWANYAYLTDEFILFTGIYQAPYTLSYAIDSNGNEIKIDNLWLGIKDIRYENGILMATSYPIGDENYYEKDVIIKYENDIITFVSEN